MRSRTALRQLAWYKVGGANRHMALIGWNWLGGWFRLLLREPIFFCISERIEGIE